MEKLLLKTLLLLLIITTQWRHVGSEESMEDVKIFFLSLSLYQCS